MKNKAKLVLLISLSFIMAFSLSLNAQNQKQADREFKKALEYINTYNEEAAIQRLNRSLGYDSIYPNSLLALAEIYYNTKSNTLSKEEYLSLSYKYYLKLVEHHPDFDPVAHVRVGDYHLKEYNVDKAEHHYYYALERLSPNRHRTSIEHIQHNIKNLAFVRHAINNPVEFEPINLGASINTEHSEYFPALIADESSLVFTRLTPNPDKTNRRSPYFEDFYISHKKDGEWTRSENMPPPFNSDVNEGALTLSPDGREAYFARCNAKDGYGSCDIYVSIRKGDKWSQPKNLGPKVNSPYWDTQPSMASDGRTLFFVSNREGGHGKSDIWYTYKNDNGEWSEAVNLGPTINTLGQEMFPFIHPSNTTLYFSSDHHIGMGGQDIFYSKIVDGRFTEPTNIGYPINTSSDETSFIVSPSGKYALFSSDIEGGMGDRDLYTFSLYEEAQPTPIVYMKGRVLDNETNSPVEAEFEIKDLETNRVIAGTISDAETGDYLLVLPMGGSYALNSKADNYLFHSENFELKQKGLESYEKDIYLSPIDTGSSVVLNNIFYATNSAELLPESKPELETLLAMLKNNPSIKIEVSGHTDNTGIAENNMLLSRQRAMSVVGYLLENGISPSRLVPKGYGQEKPIDSNETEEGKARNRRTEFKILEK